MFLFSATSFSSFRFIIFILTQKKEKNSKNFFNNDLGIRAVIIYFTVDLNKLKMIKIINIKVEI